MDLIANKRDLAACTLTVRIDPPPTLNTAPTLNNDLAEMLLQEQPSGKKGPIRAREVFSVGMLNRNGRGSCSRLSNAGMHA